MPYKNKQELEDLEFHLLLEGIFRCYGWDFRDYAQASLRRRILKCMREEHVDSVSGCQEKIFHHPNCMARFLFGVSVSVTSMFRDPLFFLCFQKNIVPELKKSSRVKIWVVGCGSGEEVYSLAILLTEAELYDQSMIYATDINEGALEKAKEGIFSLEKMQDFTGNYVKAGGTSDFSKYYTAKYDHAIFRRNVREKILWAQHNVVTDASFNEFQVILCRNVMIYFNRALQDRTHELLYESLKLGGFLGLGDKESLKFSPREGCYEAIESREKWYRKVK